MTLVGQSRTVDNLCCSLQVRVYCMLRSFFSQKPCLFVTVCEEDLPKWAARCPVWAKMGVCDEPKKQPFLHHYCRKSCKLPCKTGNISLSFAPS